MALVWIFKPYYTGIGGWNRYARDLLKYVGKKIPIGVISNSCENEREGTYVKCIDTIFGSRKCTQTNICKVLTYSSLKIKTLLSKIQLIHFPSQESFIYDLMATSSKYIMTIHGLSFLHGPADRKYVRKMLILKKRINKLSKIITVSFKAKEDIMNFFKLPDHKVEVIYNAVDRKIFNERKTVLDEYVLSKLNLLKPYFIHVSSGDRVKNIEYILKALKFSRKSNYLLVLVGVSGHNKERIINYASSHGLLNRIMIIPPIRNDFVLAILYRNALAFVLPSYYESCPYSLLEAMSTGTLCIVSNRGALPEIAGDAAFYVDLNNPMELARLLDDIYSGKYNLLNVAGIRRVIKYFNFDIFTYKHVSVYREVLDM